MLQPLETSWETSHAGLTFSERSDDEVDLVCRVTESSLVSEHVAGEGIQDLTDYRQSCYQAALSEDTYRVIMIHYIAKSIGTPSNERFECFSNLHECKS